MYRTVIIVFHLLLRITQLDVLYKNFRYSYFIVWDLRFWQQCCWRFKTCGMWRCTVWGYTCFFYVQGQAVEIQALWAFETSGNATQRHLPESWNLPFQVHFPRAVGTLLCKLFRVELGLSGWRYDQLRCIVYLPGSVWCKVLHTFGWDAIIRQTRERRLHLEKLKNHDSYGGKGRHTGQNLVEGKEG